MRERLYKILNKVYGLVMSVAFFAGIVPLVPFIIAMIIGGTTGEKIAIFISKQVYPVIISLASIAILIGWVAMYVGKKESLSVKKISANDKEK